MERLLQIARATLWLGILTAHVGMAHSHCSLVVEVVNPAGRNTPANVTVTEPATGRMHSQNADSGTARFCDLGILPVRVSVGHEACNQVVINNQQLSWGKTTTVSVIYDREPCLNDPPATGGCSILLRIVDEHTVAVPGAVISIAKRSPFKSDQFGRVLVGITGATTHRAIVSGKGFSEAEVELQCKPVRKMSEQMIQLRRN